MIVDKNGRRTDTQWYRFCYVSSFVYQEEEVKSCSREPAIFPESFWWWRWYWWYRCILLQLSLIYLFPCALSFPSFQAEIYCAEGNINGRLERRRYRENILCFLFHSVGRFCSLMPTVLVVAILSSIFTCSCFFLPV